MEKYYKFSLNMKLANIIAGILSVLFIILLFVLVNNEVLIYHGYFIMSLYLMYMVLHELCHGLGYVLFVKDKSNIKFGAVLEKGVLYAMCQEKLTKKQIMISLLLPLLLLSVLVLPIAIIFKNADLFFLAGLNLIGSIGDIAMLKLISRMPSDIKYIDLDSEIGTYLLSKKDITKYQTKMLKYTESGKYSNSLIAKDIKKVHITKASLICFIMFILLDILIML